MARLNWSAVGKRYYETGIDRGVLYVGDQPGVVWTGLTSVDESPSGGEPKAYYIDGIKYLNVSANEEFEATLHAFTYPEEFGQCDGTAQVRPGLFVTQQRRKCFGLSYRTMIGNDLEGSDHGYKIHIVYNAMASPSQRTGTTRNDSPEPTAFSWNITTRPSVFSGYKHSAHVEIDSRLAHPSALSTIEDILYGSESASARIPSYSELVEVFDSFGDLVVIDNGDGTFTVNAPITILEMLDSSTFEITAPTAVLVSEGSYTISS